MSEENVELLRRGFESLNEVGRVDPEERDPEVLMPELWDRVDPGVELHERSDLPDAQVYRDRESSKGFWRRTVVMFSEMRWEPLDFIDLGDAVVVEAKVFGVGRGSEVPIEAYEADVFCFRDGRIVRIMGFPSKDEALEAARSFSA
jgi:ketosteroid isomerase-like protein